MGDNYCVWDSITIDKNGDGQLKKIIYGYVHHIQNYKVGLDNLLLVKTYLWLMQKTKVNKHKLRILKCVESLSKIHACAFDYELSLSNL